MIDNNITLYDARYLLTPALIPHAPEVIHLLSNLLSKSGDSSLYLLSSIQYLNKFKILLIILFNDCDFNKECLINEIKQTIACLDFSKRFDIFNELCSSSKSNSDFYPFLYDLFFPDQLLFDSTFNYELYSQEFPIDEKMLVSRKFLIKACKINSHPEKYELNPSFSVNIEPLNEKTDLRIHYPLFLKNINFLMIIFLNTSDKRKIEFLSKIKELFNYEEFIKRQNEAFFVMLFKSFINNKDFIKCIFAHIFNDSSDDFKSKFMIYFLKYNFKAESYSGFKITSSVYYDLIEIRDFNKIYQEFISNALTEEQKKDPSQKVNPCAQSFCEDHEITRYNFRNRNQKRGAEYIEIYPLKSAKSGLLINDERDTAINNQTLVHRESKEINPEKQYLLNYIFRISKSKEYRLAIASRHDRTNSKSKNYANGELSFNLKRVHENPMDDKFPRKKI